MAIGCNYNSKMISLKPLKRAAMISVAGVVLLSGTYTIGTYSHYTNQLVPLPANHSLQAKECKPKEMDTSQLNDSLLKMKNRAGWKLWSSSVKLHDNPTISQLEEIANQALPYIGSVLGNPRVHRPKIVLVETLDAPSPAAFNPNTYQIEIARVPFVGSFDVASSKNNVTHETVHSQYLNGNIIDAFIHTHYGLLTSLPEKYKPQEKFLKHPFVEPIVIEVLARQALDGDNFAKYAFARRVQEILGESTKAKNEGYSHPTTKENFVKPAEIILDIMSCKKSGIEGVKLYAIRELVRKEITDLKQVPRTNQNQFRPKYR